MTRINISSIGKRYSYLKDIYGSGIITFVISNKEMKDIRKIVKFLGESSLLI